MIYSPCYREALNAPGCEAIHLTDIETSFQCDTFIPPVDCSVFRPWYSSFPLLENSIRYSFVTYVRVQSSGTEPHAARDGEVVDSKSIKDKFKVERFLFLPKLIYERHEEYAYLRLVKDIIANGARKNDRTGTGTLSKFGCQVFCLHLFSFTSPANTLFPLGPYKNPNQLYPIDAV